MLSEKRAMIRRRDELANRIRESRQILAEGRGA
jgi:hypothetical protein